MADHVETEPLNTGEVPTIPPRWRTRVYVGCLLLNIATLVVLGLAVVFEFISMGKAAAAATIVLAAINLLSSGLGVAYRPTRAGLLQ